MYFTCEQTETGLICFCLSVCLLVFVFTYLFYLFVFLLIIIISIIIIFFSRALLFDYSDRFQNFCRCAYKLYRDPLYFLNKSNVIINKVFFFLNNEPRGCMKKNMFSRIMQQLCVDVYRGKVEWEGIVWETSVSENKDFPQEQDQPNCNTMRKLLD